MIAQLESAEVSEIRFNIKITFEGKDYRYVAEYIPGLNKINHVDAVGEVPEDTKAANEALDLAYRLAKQVSLGNYYVNVSELSKTRIKIH